jgi:UDP-glucose 4-epimerase
MRIAITGGAGFIGANLVRHLTAADGITGVAVVDDLSTGDAANLVGVDADLRVGSILDADLLDELVPDADAVVHLAAVPSVPRSVEDPVTSHTANATGTLTVLEAARRAGNPHVIVASSSSVYGANPTLPKSEDLATAPLSPYAVTKLTTENYALAYAHCYGLPVLAFRFFNVFGPLQSAGHDYAAAIPTFVDAALRGHRIPIHGDGGQTRDFTFVGSVAAVITEALLRRTSADGPVNLAFGSRRTLLDVVDAIGEVLGRDLEREHGPPRPGDVRHSQADQTRLRRLFPDIEPVDFVTGLRETIAWFTTLPDYAPITAEP